MAAKAGRAFAFQGELGAFSYAAGQKLLGTEIRALACATFREAFESVKAGRAAYAVLPMENTLHGSVHENYDNLLEYGFPVVGETSLRISHQLITMPDVRWSEVRRAFSHPVALNQCRQFFSKHQNLEPVPYYDTAGSVKMLSEEHPQGTAAIASAAAAKLFGGVIRQRNIEDDPQNFTRFFLLSKQPLKLPPVSPAKTALVFSTANEPGSLFKALACFALRDISLTKIESRPLRGKPWEYLFYLDLLGSTREKRVQNALSNLGELTDFIKILGCYQPTP